MTRPAAGPHDEPARPPARRWLVAAVTALLLAAGAMALVAGRLDGAPGGAASDRLLLLLLLVLAASLGLEYRARGEGDRLDLFDAALAAALVSLPGPEVVVLVALAKAVGLTVQRVPADKTCFNVAQWACAAAGGSLVVAALDEPAASPARELLVLLLALVVVAVLNVASVVVVLGVMGGRGVLREDSRGLLYGALVSAPTNVALGLVFATIWVQAPASRPVIPVALLAVHLASRLWAQQQAGTSRLVGLQRATAVLAGPDELDGAAPRFLAELRSAFDCAGAELHLRIGPDEAWTRRASGHDGGADASAALVAALVRRDVAVRLPGPAHDQVLLTLLRDRGWRDCLAVPVRTDGRVVGVLCTHDRAGWEGFESNELAVLEAVAGVLGEAAHRNELTTVLRSERAALRESQRRWQVVAGILELVARDTPLPETLDRLARSVEEHTDGARCLVVVEAPGQQPTLAAPTLAAPAAAALRSVLVDALTAVDASGQGRPGAESLRAPAGTGFAALRTWQLPCSSDGGAAGVLALAYPHGAAVPDQFPLAADAARLAGLAVDHVLVQQRLAHHAEHDALTDLPNRAVFQDRVEHALRSSERTRTWVLVLFLDLDRFKVVNDSLGHRAGDALLCAVAERLRAAIRPADTVARFGGDEFTILCEGITSESHAMRVVERVQQALAAPFPLGQDELFASASIGIALGRGAAKTPELLLEDADAAMYRAKALGGDRAELFDAGMRDRAVERLATQSALHRALERGEFRVVYQPTVRLSTGQLESVEALVRWARPDHGIVRPADFVPLAEETGLIVPIGAFVLEEACRQAGRWRHDAGRGGSVLSVSVNLSARQLADPDLIGLVEGALQRSSVDPSWLSLEITESVLMSDVAASGAVLDELKALGVRLLVDDFGTGYSSLAYLQRFPVDGLKVDQSFVAGLGARAESATIVGAVIGLARGLGLTAVAEGVETAEQVRHLIDLDCDVAQGYHFGRPVPAEQLRLDRGRSSAPQWSRTAS